MGVVVLVLLILIVLILASCVKIVPQAYAYVVERLGAYQGFISRRLKGAHPSGLCLCYRKVNTSLVPLVFI